MSKLPFRSFALSLQNNYKFIAVTGLLYLFEPITLDEKNGICLMNWTDVGIAATEKLSARLVVMAKDTCSVQETEGVRTASCRKVYSDALRGAGQW